MHEAKNSFLLLLALLFSGVFAHATSQQWYEYYYNKANRYLLTGNAPAALYYSDSALSFNNKADTIYTLRASAYIRLNRYPQAFEQSNTALSINPKNANAYFICAIARANTDVYNDSLSDQIIKHKKDKDWLKENVYTRYYTISSLTSISFYDYATAIRDIDSSLFHNPSNTLAHHYRAFYYYNLGFYEKSVTDYNACLEQDTTRVNKAVYYLGIGQCNEKLLKSFEALEAYTQGIQSDPGNANLYENRGKLYYNAWHDREYACNDLRQAVLLGQYIEDIEKYCTPSYYDLAFRYEGSRPWRQNTQPCNCPQLNPETDTLIKREIEPGIFVEELTIKPAELDTFIFDDGTVMQVSKKTKERWNQERRNNQRNP